MRPKLSYANVTATLALIIAVGGASAFAATQLAKNSVGAKQLKKNAVTNAKIKNGAVTGAKIKLSTLGTVPSAGHASSADSAAALAPPEPVHFIGIPGEPLFESGYANYGFEYGATGFYRDRDCTVHLLGVARGPSGQQAFRLPAAYAPPQRVFEPTAIAGVEEPGVVDISTAGDVVPRTETGGPITIFGLDGVTFRAAAC
jgi:hypothetical protein